MIAKFWSWMSYWAHFSLLLSKSRPSRKILGNQDRPWEHMQGRLGSAYKMDSVEQTMMSEEDRQGLWDLRRRGWLPRVGKAVRQGLAHAQSRSMAANWHSALRLSPHKPSPAMKQVARPWPLPEISNQIFKLRQGSSPDNENHGIVLAVFISFLITSSFLGLVWLWVYNRVLKLTPSLHFLKFVRYYSAL